jgi:trans-aconitate 2-methyltransferase
MPGAMAPPDNDSDGWDPGQYERFAAERAQPFFDLLALVRPVPGGDVVDLGCGTGELTSVLHHRVEAARTLGIDSSPAMLERAAAVATPELRFEAGDIGRFDAEHAFDLVFANASLQWVPDHEALLTRLHHALRPGGQLAVQVPANADHASHTVAAEVAAETPFRQAMHDAPPPDVVRGVLRPEEYAELLDRHGFVEQHVRLQVYGHHLSSTDDVVEWTKGTALVRFRRLLPPEMFEEFVDAYRRRLRQVLGAHSPYFYAFKRILFWGRTA